MTTRCATRDSLVMASYEEAVVLIVLFLWLQYCTVRAKHRNESKRRELAQKLFSPSSIGMKLRHPAYSTGTYYL